MHAIHFASDRFPESGGDGLVITDASSIHKILVVTLSNLGDVVLTLPVLEQLHEAYPQATLDVIVGESAKIVFEGDARIRKIVCLNKKASLRDKWLSLRSIRQEKYDIVIDLKRSLLGLCGGARYRNSYLVRSGHAHRADKHLASLKGLIHSQPAPKWLGSHERAIGSEFSIDLERPMIAAAVGSKSDIKKWPAVHYAQLLDRLASERGHQIVLIGDKADVKDAERVQTAMKHKVVNLCGQTSFTQLVAVIGRADMVVTNDSAPLHIADALRVPLLALFGPTDPMKYGPRGARSAALSRKIFCSPCEKAQCRYGHECLNLLSVDQVYDKATQILDDGLRKEGLKFLIMRLDRVGDLVLSLPAIDALRQQYPDSKITVMTRPYTQDLLKGHPWIDDVWAYDYKKGGAHTFPLGYARLIREIRSRKYDAAFIMHPGIRSHLIPYLAGITYRIGYKNSSSLFLTHAIEDKRHLGLEHESEYAMHLVEAFGVPRPIIPSKRLLFPRNHSESGASAPVIAIHAGASCASKRWPKEYFRRLIELILESHPHRIAIIGGEDEIALGAYLSNGLDEKVIDMTGRQSLDELTEFLASCEALVSNDSGPVHIAAAVEVPVVSIFGRNQAGLSARRWRPLGASHRVIQKDVGCVVCLAHRCTIDFECLKAIKVETVYQALFRILTRKHEKSATPFLR
jgi:heptosyltransferase-2